MTNDGRPARLAANMSSEDRLAIGHATMVAFLDAYMRLGVAFAIVSDEEFARLTAEERKALDADPASVNGRTARMLVDLYDGTRGVVRGHD